MSASLPDWIDRTRKAVDVASNDVLNRAELDAVARVRDDLEGLLTQLRPLAQAAALGRGEWWDGYEVPGDLASAMRAAASKQEQRELDRAVRLLSTFKTAAQAQMIERWRTHVTARAAGAAELRGLVDYLGGSEDVTFDADHLNRLLGDVARSQGRVPTPEVVEALEEALRLLAVLEQLLPPHVRTFLGAALRGGAPLESLTPAVTSWLEQRGISAQFRILPGPPAASNA